jgi:5-methylcytosine-specific restriction protein A
VPVSPARPCQWPLCPRTVSTGRFCEEHKRKRLPLTPKPRPPAHERGYDWEWRKKRNAYLKANPFCELCGNPATEVHHRKPKAEGGTDDDYNLRSLCHSDHVTITAQLSKPFRPQPFRRTFPTGAYMARLRDPAQLAQSRVLHLIGLPGTGKSWLRQAIEQRLELPCFAIDEERTKLLRPGEWWPRDDDLAWCALEDAANAYPRCCIETMGTHQYEPLLFNGRQVFTVLCTASPEVRRQRLQDRVRSGGRLVGGRGDYVDRLMRVQLPAIHTDAVWDSDPSDHAEDDLDVLLSRVSAFMLG